jgi:allophanate hydrolase subunit 2
MSHSSCLLQGRPLKAGDYLPLGSVAADVEPKAGAEVPAAWRPSYPAAKVLP